MSLQMFYVDESFDDEKFCLTGMWIRHREWQACFDAIRAHRVELKDTYGIRIRKEIHARELVAGRGDLGTPTPLGKWERSRIFLGLLRLIARLPVRLINICLEVSKFGPTVHLIAWDRLVNRIQRTMRAIDDDDEVTIRKRLMVAAERTMPSEDCGQLRQRLEAFACRAMILSDEGHEKDITSALRRMHVFNPIPSKFGEWPSGHRAKSIPTDKIIEDPVFRKSSVSPILQLVDCVAFALLKRETAPTPLVKRYNIHKMFDATLASSCFTKASASDPLGIVRG